MPETGIHDAQLIMLLLLVFVAAFAALARRLKTPYPIVLVVAGLLLGFVPGIPRIALEPDLIFLVVTPPLLYAAASITSWRDFSYNLVNIAMLAFGLVGFTVVCVAIAGPSLFPGFDWRIGLVLGAAVCTTDAIAATSIAKHIGLPKRIVDLLEGESLLNDATGLLALEFATAIVVHGQHPTVNSSVVRFLYLIFAGIASGLTLAVIVEWLEHRIDDGPIEIAVSILVPYAAFLTAEAFHASGVLAVVAAGLYLGRKSSEFLSPGVRLQTQAVWNSLTFILNGFVFVLIGLQLPSVLAGVRELSLGKIVLYGAIFSLFLILLRLFWTFPGAYAAYLIRTRVLHQNEKPPSARQVFVVGWTGMRGVIALAAAMSLPKILADGSPFPHRDLIVFLTFCVIVVTLVFQGLTLSPLIRMLGLAETSGPKCEEREAHRLVLEAAQTHLEHIRVSDSSGLAEIYDDLAQHYKHRLASASGRSQEQRGAHEEHYFRYLDLSRTLLDVERQAALRLRDEGRITDEVWREMENEMDLTETRLIVAMDRHA
ncbi:MAG TPA: Na+/H+ antiporter [Bryobacteraceae bacterium]|jgi:CPA1 family monovalent cation:H+ antiporter|nr:Na+/H+ antiporter [Bryobacteraceae bacterium]